MMEDDMALGGLKDLPHLQPFDSFPDPSYTRKFYSKQWSMVVIRDSSSPNTNAAAADDDFSIFPPGNHENLNPSHFVPDLKNPPPSPLSPLSFSPSDFDSQDKPHRRLNLPASHRQLVAVHSEQRLTMESSSNKGEEEVGGYNSSNVKKAKLQSTLTALLDDPILADVPQRPALMDVDTLISLEFGSAMRIFVLKLDSTSFDVAIMNSATVKELQLAIKKKVTETEQSKMGHRHISWKHVWANYSLSYNNQKLLDDNAPLQDFGLRNNSQVHFVPHVMSKNSRRHSKRRKHRFFHGLNSKSLFFGIEFTGVGGIRKGIEGLEVRQVLETTQSHVVLHHC